MGGKNTLFQSLVVQVSTRLKGACYDMLAIKKEKYMLGLQVTYFLIIMK